MQFKTIAEAWTCGCARREKSARVEPTRFLEWRWWKAEISAVSSRCAQPIQQQKGSDSSLRKQTTRQRKLHHDAIPMALSPPRYQKHSAESFGSSHLISTSAFVRTGNSSCGSRCAHRWSSARRAPYRPLPGSERSRAARRIPRVGAVLSFVYPAYLNSETQFRFTELGLHLCCDGHTTRLELRDPSRVGFSLG